MFTLYRARALCFIFIYCISSLLFSDTLLQAKPSSHNSAENIDMSFLNDDADNGSSLQDDPDAPRESEEEDELLELYARFTENANSIASTIQHLCQLTAQERTVGTSPIRIANVVEWLNAVQKENAKVRETPVAPITMHQLYVCFNAQGELIRAISESLYNNFRHLIDVSQTIDEALETDTIRGKINAKKVREREEQIGKKLKILAKNVEESGLSSFNKFYTKISPFVPWALIGGTACAAIWGGWKLYEKSGDLSPKNLAILSNGIERGQEQIVMSIVNNLFWGTLATIPPIYLWTKKHYNIFDSYLRGNKFKPSDEQVDIDDKIDLDDTCFAHMREKLEPIYRMVEYIKNPQKYSLAGIKNYKAVLLVGEPGSGKSFLARAIAGQLQKTIGHSVMISVTIDHYIEKGGIKRIFEDAKQRSGCVVIFLDEIHLYGVQAEKNVQGLQELLACLDDLDRETDPQKQVFIIAATNRPDLIEDPLKRQGRFGTIIELTKPVFADRIDILTTLCKKSAINPEELQVERFAKLTRGRPMSDLVSMFSQACFLAKSENRPVSFDHMYRALNLKLRKLSETINLKPDEVKVISTHLSGVACALLNLKTSQQLDMITLYAEQKKIAARYDIIAKIKNDEDRFFIPDPGTVYTYEENELISGIGQGDRFMPARILLAGLAAQRIILGAETSYHLQDRQKALETILKTIAGGIDLKKLPHKERDAFLAQASEKLRTCEKEVEALLSEHKSEIEQLAAALAERKILRLEEINEILKKK